MKEFNLSLLGKWCWGLLKKPDELWYKVLKAKYGIMDGQVSSGGSIASSLWKDINSIRCGNDVGGGSWFRDHVERKIRLGSWWKWVGVAQTLFAWEEELRGECGFALDNIVLHDSLPNSWAWLADPDACYLLKGRIIC
ncbi:hypothetical protein L195_g041506 [Trifolium pratense]|uniref:Uncharacterized protein n=1 Tax=Trifolium pratense TaxID=57577 RepID=A0A2K3M3S2_TRIPR|nr:hypothetical protein L195_g041506 [Trifolium pratense]